MNVWDQWCRDTLDHLERTHRRRSLRPLAAVGDGGHTTIADAEGKSWVSFASNDYLGLAHHERVAEALCRAVERHGVGSGASRLVTGTHPAHLEWESSLAEFKGLEAALSFSSGYSAALGFATAFLDKDAIVLLDKLCHTSLIDAARLAGARMRVFRHHDMEKLETLLRWARRSAPRGRVVVMAESVYSMDGDLAPLKELVRLKEAFGAWLLVDEAHAVGVLGPAGRGWVAAQGLTERVDVHLGTLGKAAGVAGAYLAGSRLAMEVLINRARSFVYSTAPPPPWRRRRGWRWNCWRVKRGRHVEPGFVDGRVDWRVDWAWPSLPRPFFPGYSDRRRRHWRRRPFSAPRASLSRRSVIPRWPRVRLDCGSRFPPITRRLRLIH